MKIIIGGDLVPTKSNIDLFNSADVNSLIGEELSILWNSASMRILNLEAPFLDEENSAYKHGPNLVIPTSAMKGLKALNPSLVTLANNHILDQGEQGLKSTQDLLIKNNIPFVGAGDNVSQASKPYIIKKNGISIGIYACAEREFSIATDETPGANPFDSLESLDHIQNLRKQCDYIIVLYHGGKEHYRYPSPYLQKVCRKIVQKGADLVICQHSHCVGCQEEYKGSTIVYGQGNFIFNRYDNEYWNNGLLVEVKVSENLGIDYIPIVKTKNGIRLANNEERFSILSMYEMRSSEIQSSKFVERKYKEFAERNIESYLRAILGVGKWVSRLDRYLLNGYLLRRKCNKEFLLRTQNYIECEAHRELLVEGLKNFVERK